MLVETILDTHHTLRHLPIVMGIFGRLNTTLPSTLLYHAYEHSEDVFWEALRFACADNRSERELELLGVAAAFHDAGFMVSSTANEAIGAEMAATEMRVAATYSEQEIALVQRMILDTELRNVGSGFERSVSTALSRYLLDADLSNLGRSDFFEKGELQRREIRAEEAPFWRVTRRLIRSHRWLTTAGEAFRRRRQAENLRLLELKLDQC